MTQSQMGSYQLIPCAILMIAINAGDGLPDGAMRPSVLWKERGVLATNLPMQKIEGRVHGSL